LPWGFTPQGDFATSTEAPYPKILCDRIATILRDYAIEMGFIMLPLENLDVTDISPQRSAQALGSAVRGSKKTPPFASEFSEVKAIKRADLDPVLHKILRSPLKGGDSETAGSSSGVPSPYVIVGVFREPSDFLAEAYKARHPVDSLFPIPESLVNNMKWVVEAGPVAVTAFRNDAIRNLVKLLHDNRQMDSQIIADMPGHLRNILQKKKLFTLQQLAQSIAHPDTSVVAEASRGFAITGLAGYCWSYWSLRSHWSYNSYAIR
jgi:hypothetical protein